MPNDNHDAQGRFSSGGDSGAHGTGVTHTGNAGVSANHKAEMAKAQGRLDQARQAFAGKKSTDNADKLRAAVSRAQRAVHDLG